MFKCLSLSLTHKRHSIIVTFALTPDSIRKLAQLPCQPPREVRRSRAAREVDLFIPVHSYQNPFAESF